MAQRGGESPVEIEAKFRVGDRAALEARLARLGASSAGEEMEWNALLDDAGRTLLARGEALRVREVAGRGVLTLKGKARMSAGVKQRLELESGVEDAPRVLQILEALGFRTWFVYEKRRTTWRFAEEGRPLVTVDETPIGLFAEVEGEEPAVRAVCAELGVTEGELLSQSYAGLYVAARRADPSLPEHMTFAALRAHAEARAGGAAATP